MAFGAIAGGLGALLGGIAGGQGQTTSSRVDLAPESSTEILGRKSIEDLFPELQKLMQAGAGQQDVTAGLQAQRGLGDLLSQYAQGSFLPSQADFATAGQFAQQAFAPQQVAMRQAFEGEQQRTAQLAAQLGRPVNDPILQAKLAQEQMRGQERLGAAQAAFTSEFAQNLPMQRLQFTGQLADVRSQLASQAMANRQALIGMGSQLMQGGQNFRLQTANRVQTQGGGLGGQISGALAGAGAFMNLGNMFSQGFGASATPSTGFVAPASTAAPSALGVGNLMQQFNVPTAAAAAPSPYSLSRYPSIMPTYSNPAAPSINSMLSFGGR